jgi:hypothetical protein
MGSEFQGCCLVFVETRAVSRQDYSSSAQNLRPLLLGWLAKAREAEMEHERKFWLTGWFGDEKYLHQS